MGEGRTVTDRETVKTLIERAYESRRMGDIEAIMAFFHPESTFTLAGSNQHSAAAGRAQGHGALRTTLAGLIETFEFIERDIISLVIDGEKAAVHCRVKLRFIPKDRTVTTDLLDLWTFRDGKVVELIEFIDTALVNELMR